MRKLILKIGAFIIPILLMATTSTWGATVSISSTTYNTSTAGTDLASVDLAQWGVLSSYTNLAGTIGSSTDLFYIEDPFSSIALLSIDSSKGDYLDSQSIAGTTYYAYYLRDFIGNYYALEVDSTATPEPETYATLLVIFGIGALMYRRQKQGALESMA
jgi:hypothetical protein